VKYLVEEKARCRAGISVCDPDCLCVIFSFIRDEQPRVGLAGGGVGRGGGVRGLDAEGGQWVREGVASHWKKKKWWIGIWRGLQRLPGRQKWLMISLIFVAQCNTGGTLWTFIASASHFRQAFHHTQLWPCEIPCYFTNSQHVRVAGEREKKRERERERTCYRRLPDVPSIPWGTALENSAWTFDT